MKTRMGILVLLLILGLSPLAIAVDAKPMTNQDVINMVRAKLPENTILMAVRAAKPEFDASADGLIKLKTAGVSQSVIEAVIAVQSGSGSGTGTSVSGSAGPAAAAGSWNPEEVILLDGGGRTPMRYLTPQMRNAIRGLGWGGMAQYAVLRGASASLRLKSRQPEFLLAVPATLRQKATTLSFRWPSARITPARSWSAAATWVTRPEWRRIGSLLQRRKS